MRRTIFTLVALVLLLAVGCTENPTPTPQPPVPDTESGFKVDITNITKTTVTFDIVPSDAEASYMLTVCDAAVVEEYTKDEYFVGVLYDELAADARSQGLTFEEYMAEACDHGAMTDVTYTGLAADSRYYIIAFGVDAEAGYVLRGELFKQEFKTEAVAMVECGFDVVAEVYYNTVDFVVKPEDKTLRWHLLTVQKAMYDSYTDAEGDYGWSESAFYSRYLQNEIDQLVAQGYNDEQVIDALFLQGDKTLEARGLNARTDYLYLIAGLTVDEDGVNIVTPISTGGYTTEDALQSDMTFDIEVWNVEQLTCEVRITPSNDTDLYCALIQPWDGVSTAVEVMEQLVTQWGPMMQLMANDRGVVEHVGANRFKLDAPDMDYYVIAFGYDGGVTTAPAMVTFRTLPSDIGPERAEFEMVASDITPYGFSLMITTNDPTVYYTAGAVGPEEWDEAAYVEEFNASIDYIYEQSKAFDAMITMPQVVGTYFWNGNNRLSATGLSPDTEVMGYLLAIDSRTGHVAKVHTFPSLARTASLGTVTPTIELVGHYSGDDEAGAIFGEPDATQGKAISVVRYTSLDGASALYSTILGGDFSSESAASDAELWGECASYWSAISQSQPYSFFLTEWESDYTVVAYATDGDERAGSLARMALRPTAENKGDIDELLELVATINGDTRAVLPLSLVYDRMEE